MKRRQQEPRTMSLEPLEEYLSVAVGTRERFSISVFNPLFRHHRSDELENAQVRLHLLSRRERPDSWRLLQVQANRKITGARKPGVYAVQVAAVNSVVIQ